MTDLFPKLDFNLNRPLIEFSGENLLETVEKKLSPGTIDIEIATLALDELEQRRKATRKARAAKKVFNEAGIKPIPWLQDARESLKFMEPTVKKNHRGYLYVILKSGYSKRNGFYSAYVGSSKHPPEIRFQQHKKGEFSARGLPKRGEQILRSLCWPGIKDNGKWKTVPNSKELRLLWESALHICLETAVLKVTGDVKYPLETWPDNFQAELQKRIKMGQAVK